MQFENEFQVAAAPAQVFETMLDIPRVAGCLPGAAIGEAAVDGGYSASIVVKVGPIRMTYGGTVQVSERDDANRAAKLLATGREQRGQGTAQATISMRAEPQGDGTRVTMATDMLVSGRVAQMGQGIMEEVASAMIEQFAACLESQLGPAATGGATPSPPPAPAKEVKALPLVLRAIGARIRRIFTRG